MLGNAYRARDFVERSIHALREAVDRQRYDEAMRVDLGEAFLEAELYEEALDAFEKARKVFDKSPAVELGLARSYRALERFELAAKHAKRSLTLQPESKEARELLEAVEAETEQEDLAQKSP